MSNSFGTSLDCSPAGSLSMGFPSQEYWSRLPFPFQGDLPWPRDWTRVFCIGRWILYHWATKEAQILIQSTQVYRWDIHLSKFRKYSDRLFFFFFKREWRRGKRGEEGRRRKPFLREDFTVKLTIKYRKQRYKYHYTELFTGYLKI